MFAPVAVDRRTFLAGAGSLFLSTLDAQATGILDQTETLLASCIKQRDGSYGAVILNDRAQLITQFDLPGRGHDIVFEHTSKKAIAFARRPGNFAVIFQVDNSAPPQTIIAAKGRHFYGHGVFSADGKLLFASENDFEASIGKIGIYDAFNDFARIGEFESHGIGPHEILLMPDGKTLAIANGGIETHPEFGRAKLNLSTMQPSLVFLNVETGDLIEKHVLSKNLNRLSIRHMAATLDGGVIFGCQYQGPKSDMPPLVGRCDKGVGIKTWQLASNKVLANYTSSVAVTRDGKHAAISSSKGGIFVVVDTACGNQIKVVEMEGCGGLASMKGGVIASSDRGILEGEEFTRQYAYLFDNHLAQSVGA